MSGGRCPGTSLGRTSPWNGVPGRSELIHPLGYRSALVSQWHWARLIVDRPERLMDLDECAVRQPPDQPGLDTAFQHVPVAALKT